uniref:Uncharacterized protein n=1 Tax=Nicotiana tabacum TaxID=4097 RepID=A0A1S4DJE0_TOBAC|nr:PREDICTED: uncharacterized protein LOC107830471 [Nicotiana tabacum]
MPLGLKNIVATYQRLVTKMFKEQLGKTIEVYIDDTLVKSQRGEDRIDHLKETFDILRRYRIKLNPEKCTFGVALGNFLGFLVSQRGIEVNPGQIRAIEGIPELLTTKNQVQRLTGRITALSRFISRSSDMCHKFFGVLKKDNDLGWTSECIQSLRELKAYLSSTPLLSKLEPVEQLLVYLVIPEVAEHSSKYWNMSIPKEISCDSGPLFTGKKTVEFFKKWHIKRILSTPYHPAGNGQEESSNKSILKIMKKKLENAKGLWPEMLPEVLWAYRTNPKTSTRETPYSLIYETELVIPVEVGEPNLRYSHESGASNDESRRQDLNEIDEQRDMAYIRMVTQKQQAECYYNKKSKARPLKVGDYVLKAKTLASRDPEKESWERTGMVNQ